MGDKNLVNLSFPIKGYSEGWAFRNQPEGTSPDVENVVPIDVYESRIRGGQRWGLSKYWLDALAADNPIYDDPDLWPAWEAQYFFNADDQVTSGGLYYICALDHWSGLTFSMTDDQWVVIDPSPVAWETVTDYARGAQVTDTGTTYLCAVPHTSGTLIDDINAGYWVVLTGSPSAWVTLTPYGIGDQVTSDAVDYACIIAHTSAAAFELVATLWILVVAMPSFIQAIGVITDLAVDAAADGVPAGEVVPDPIPPTWPAWLPWPTWVPPGSDFRFIDFYTFEQSDGPLAAPTPSDWATATPYTVRTRVKKTSKNYVCLVDHTSDDFATDLAASNWAPEISWTLLDTTLLTSVGGGRHFFEGTSQPAVVSDVASLTADPLNDPYATQTVGGNGATTMFNSPSYEITMNAAAIFTGVSDIQDLPECGWGAGFAEHTINAGFRVRTDQPTFSPTWTPICIFAGVSLTIRSRRLAPSMTLDTMLNTMDVTIGSYSASHVFDESYAGLEVWQRPSWWATPREMKLVVSGSTYTLYADGHLLGSTSLTNPALFGGSYAGWEIGFMTQDNGDLPNSFTYSATVGDFRYTEFP